MLFDLFTYRYVVILEVWGRTHWRECQNKDEADAWVNMVLTQEKRAFPHGDFTPKYYQVR